MTSPSDSERVLVWAPSGSDGERATKVLERAGLSAIEGNDVERVIADIAEGAGCALIAEEALTAAVEAQLSSELSRQPAWSDFPLVIVASDSRRLARDENAFARLGNVTLLERPLKSRILVGAVQAALRGRRRQYEARHAIVQRDQFLAMLGHELRNPLSAILLSIEAINRVPDDAHPAKRHHAAIDRQARHLSRLVDDLLDVARVTSGKVVVRRAPVDCNALVARCAAAFESTAAARRIGLRVEPAPAQAWIDGDEDRVEQVVNNLLVNALKYSPDGASVTASVVADGAHLELRVRDTGIGIAAPMLQRVFDLFAQAEPALDRAQGGLGLGLTLVKSLVELHGGSIEARSEGPGRGSEFVVRLPRSEPPSVEATVVDETVPATGGALRLVVVEDSVDIRETLSELLEDLDFDVQTAADGPSGLDRILSRRPDVALVDIGLPGLDGYAIAERVRATLGSKVFLVALTGYGQPEDRQRALAAGFDTHITKPVTLRTIEKVLEQATRRDHPGAAATHA